MKLMKGKTTLYFDRILKTKNGFVSGIELLPIFENMAITTVELRKMKNMIDINNLHTILGHCSEATARMTGKAYVYDVVGVSSFVKPALNHRMLMRNV